MNFKKTLITLSIAAMTMPAFALDFLPLGAPDFSKIKETDYLPAFEKAIKQNRDEVSKIQIDHVVALSDAWQKGAQYMDYDVRNAMATDPLNLIAVDGDANKKKSDGDAATWLPPNKRFRCQYVARQVSVKYKYSLWVTDAEKQAIGRILANCPKEPCIGI